MRVSIFHLIRVIGCGGGPSEAIILHASITKNNKIVFNYFENSPECYWPNLDPCKRNEGYWFRCNSNHNAINNNNCTSFEYSF